MNGVYPSQLSADDVLFGHEITADKTVFVPIQHVHPVTGADSPLIMYAPGLHVIMQGVSGMVLGSPWRQTKTLDDILSYLRALQARCAAHAKLLWDVDTISNVVDNGNVRASYDCKTCFVYSPAGEKFRLRDLCVIPPVNALLHVRGISWPSVMEPVRLVIECVGLQVTVDPTPLVPSANMFGSVSGTPARKRMGDTPSNLLPGTEEDAPVKQDSGHTLECDGDEEIVEADTAPAPEPPTPPAPPAPPAPTPAPAPEAPAPAPKRRRAPRKKKEAPPAATGPAPAPAPPAAPTPPEPAPAPAAPAAPPAPAPPTDEEMVDVVAKE